MDYGLILPSLGAGASRESVEAACEAAERHGWRDVWTTDHLLVDHTAKADYGRIYEAVTTLAWIAGRYRTVGIGTSVIVVPMRNAVVLAKELATIDDLSGGRLTVGVGAGWSEVEFRNVGLDERYKVRGAYLEETINLFRHLWSGSREPFHGRFHTFDDFEFEPLPPQRAALPIWIGGRSEKAYERAGRLADVYHASASRPAQIAERIPFIRAGAEAAGRPMPGLSGRVRVELDLEPLDQLYAIRGNAEEVAAEIRAFAEVGVSHLALTFRSREPEALTREIDRFVAEVVPLVG